MNISIIYGKAGTGKSTYLASLIRKCTDYVVLTATHASLENIYQITNIPDHSKFKTIYSFFRIDYRNNTLLGAKMIPKNIFIDEFSLIDKYLFKKIINDIASKTFEVNVVLCGDALQLNAIYQDKQYISFSKMRKINSIVDMNLSPNVLEHFHLSIFGMKVMSSAVKKMLTKNLRSDNIIGDTLTAIYKRDESFDYKFVSEMEVINCLMNNYVFLSSKYEILQHIYDRLAERWNDKLTIEQHISFRVGLKRLYLYPGQSIILTITSEEKHDGVPIYYNGEMVTFTGNVECKSLKCLNSNNEIIYIKQEKETDTEKGEYYFPVIPANLTTIHKSQGRSIDSVIVCIDDLFDMSMLYTAVTRCRKNLKFYTKDVNRKKKLFDSAYIDDFKQLNYLMNKWCVRH